VSGSLSRLATAGGVLFWLVWAWDSVISFAILCTFYWALVDGPMVSFKILLWIVILFMLSVVMIGSLALRLKGRAVPALILALLLAVPGGLAALLALLLVIAHPL
jgi:hypothetical protein